SLHITQIHPPEMIVPSKLIDLYAGHVKTKILAPDENMIRAQLNGPIHLDLLPKVHGCNHSVATKFGIFIACQSCGFHMAF
ncbi:MAG: hypothetical protein WAJ95_21645, partial [Desulfobacterales bacterium]